MKRAHIEAGVTGFVEKLEVVSIAEILVGVSAMDSCKSEWVPRISQVTSNQGTHPPGEGASEVQVPSLRPQETQDVQANEAPPTLVYQANGWGSYETTGNSFCQRNLLRSLGGVVGKTRWGER